MKEKRILDYLDKEHIVWVPMVDKKEESQEKKKFEILMANKANIGAGKSDLLERRKFLVPKVKLSSSCDNLTDLLQAEQVIEET